MKSTLFAALAALVTGVQASFDLMLIPGNDNRIYRYDPLNNVQLGSYGTQGNSNLIAADNRGISYSSTGSNSLQAIRYSSGEQVNMITGSVSARAHELAGDYVYVLGSNSVRRTHITNGSSIVSTGVGTIDFRSMAVFGNNMIVAGLNSSNQISVTNFDLSSLTFGAAITSTFSVASGSILGKAAIVQSPASGAVSLLYTYSNGANAVAMRMTLNSSGQITSNSYSAQTLSNFNVTTFMPGFMAAHGGGAWVLGRDSVGASSFRVTRIDLSAFGTPLEGDSTTFAAQGGAFPAGTSDIHGATIIAPEPSVFIPLSLGLLMVKGRRKK